MNHIYYFSLVFLILLVPSYGRTQDRSEIVFGSYNQPFKLEHDRFFNTYFKKFKSLVGKNDAKAIAKLFSGSYPFPVILRKNTGTEGETIVIKIKSEDDFMRYYTKIFDPAIRAWVKNLKVSGLHLREGGITTEKDQLWWLYSYEKKYIKISYIANTMKR